MRALEGIRVIDASNIIAGPYAASIMSEFGADVIKVEMPGKGDGFRSMGPRSRDGKSIRWPSMGRNKRCITLDFHYEEGREIFLDLVKQADVLIENFRTGTLDKWGLDLATLRNANPKIIVTRITGYGQTGPYKSQSGFGAPCTAFSGIVYTTGYPDKPPVSPSFSLADYVAGMNAVIGKMFALYYRDQQNGAAQEIDVALYEGLFRMQDSMIADYDINGKIRERQELVEGGSVPGGKFLTSDNKWVLLTCATNNAYKYWTEAMNRPDLFEKYPDMKDRFENSSIIMEETANWFASHTASEAIKICAENKVALSPVYSIADIFEDQQYKARNNLLEFDSPDFGTIHIPAPCPVLSVTPGEVRWLGQPLGSANEEIYKGMLGMTGERLDELKSKGVI